MVGIIHVFNHDDGGDHCDVVIVVIVDLSLSCVRFVFFVLDFSH